jgi:hypothetical protein
LSLIRENNPFLSTEDALKIFELRLKELAKLNPFIVWYRIYPENGKVEKLSSAPEGGAYFRNGWENDVWRPMPDGSVKMGCQKPLSANTKNR